MIQNNNVRRLARIGMLSALAIVLVLFVHFPLIPAAPFLEYDPGDIPILIVTFMYGPWYGLMMTVVVSVIQGVSVSAGSGWIGIVMHILSTGAFCIVAGLIYRRKRTIQGAVLALAAGVLVTTVVMAGCNLIFMPMFLADSTARDVAAMLIPIIIPFNLLKAGINAVATFLLYKSIGRLFGLLDDRAEKTIENRK